MIDLCTRIAERTIPVRSVDVVIIAGAPALSLRHAPVSQIARVTVNGQEVTWVRTSDQALTCDLPAGAQKTGINSVAITTNDAAPIGVSVAVKNRIRVGAPVTGAERVAQLFVNTLLTRKGSNKFSPATGTLLYTAMTHKDGLSQARLVVLNAIQDAANQILRAQSGSANLPASERLITAKLDTLNLEGASIRASVRLVTGDGIEAMVTAQT